MKLSKHIHRASWLRRLRSTNVDDRERLISLLVGAGLAGLGLRRWKSPVLAVGLAGLLLRRALTGNCPLYRRLGLSSA